MSARLVSVIVPTRNSARTIAACLESVRAQTYRPLEVVVVDNGSSDSTVAIAAGLADRVEAFGPERSAQRNHGAAVARGDYLLFIDSDMRLRPEVVADCVATIAATGAPGVIIPETSIGEGFWARCRALERSCYVGDDSVEAARFFPCSVFEASGGYDEALSGPEDWDLSQRVAAGRSLPRTKAMIDHDEGRLGLRDHLAKKRYYGATFRRYLGKQRSSMGRAGVLIIRPAYLRNWRRLAEHPILTAGIFGLKGLELGAAALGVLTGRRRQPTV
ncbi:MAG TPA: glycosyltransferase [Candidatus Dormibacteraeota bacterium]|nr:glycosyltransferase [Candidatus Dormibacteraeota bacterium]